jgi:hypothetical protein
MASKLLQSLKSIG